MTAEIAILNKYGVALAADSICTLNLSKGKKFITVEKLFDLSKDHPVGIMIYDTPYFTDIPCETIIKVYRTYIQNTHFDTLQEYADDFFRFLSKDKRVYNSGYEKRFVRSVLDYCLMENMPRLKSRRKPEQTLSDNVEEKIKDFLNMRFLDGFNDNFIQLFLETHGEYLKRYMNEIDNIRIDKKTQENIVLLCAHIISKKDGLFDDEPSTNIIIAGYGSKEIFPSLIEYKIISVISGVLICEPINNVKVEAEEIKTESKDEFKAESKDFKVESIIMPFAQREIVDTYTKGIDTELKKVIFDKINTIFNNFYEKIQEAIQSEANNNLTREFSSEERDKIKRLGQTLKEEIKEKFEKQQYDSYIEPFLKMCTFLGKEEIISLAEALVNLTSTRRRFTPDEETVGGLTEVVIITKVDGFKWVKKKEFFKPKLNTGQFNTR